MKDAIVKRLKDQLFMARAHYPSVAKLKQLERFTCELKQNIQELERMLSDTITDADLPPFFAEKLEKMDHTIERAECCEVGCLIVERKLRQLLDITEDEAYFHTRQSAFLYHLGVRTRPKTHHCLNMRLTVEYSYLEATVRVTYIEDNQKLSKDVDSLEMQQLWPAEEFCVTILNHSEPSQRQMKTECICIFGHSSFLLPDLPTLNRVVVLDDDLIVQKYLLSLWSLDMGSKVISAV